MYKGKILIIGLIGILFFIGWFYFKELDLLNLDSNTANEEVDELVSKSDNEKNPFTRTDSQGEISIETTFLPQESSNDQLVFEIEMNTHTGDLSPYEMNKLAQISFGNIIHTKGEFNWEWQEEDSHHMVGVLIWKGKVANGDLTLELRNIDNVNKRTFIWKEKDLSILK